MSAPTWQDSLAQALSLSRPPNQTRLAIVGIGSELRGDDAAGVLIVRALQKKNDAESSVDDSASSRVLILEGGTAPENMTGPLRRFQPDLVLLSDAAEMGEKPDTVRWLDPHDADSFSASTHMLPLHILTQYLETELDCTVALLGIQPAALEFDTGLSPEMEQAIDVVVDDIRKLLVAKE